MSTTTINAPARSNTIEITRTFAAAPDVVLRAYTEPELLKRWLGPAQYQMEVAVWELRRGGRWRFIHRSADGAEFGFRGVYHEKPSVEAGIVWTWEYEGAAGHVSLETTDFTAAPDGTVVHTTAVYQSLADRDAMLESGMEGGLNEGFDRLDALLATD